MVEQNPLSGNKIWLNDGHGVFTDSGQSLGDSNTWNAALGDLSGDGILSVGSLIGFITVFGIATRNGIMLVSHIRHLQLREGVRDLYTAVLRGSHERFVPIAMTALASGFALIPLAMASGEPGSEIQTPMAWVILGGLVSSTLLNMFVVPALYLRFGKSISPEVSR